jgi:glutathione S-transferase kappa 1
MRIELFYDVVSPYSYLAFTALERWAPRWQAELELRPFFLGGVMKAVGNTPPIMLAARAPYLARDITRQAEYFDVPLALPSAFPPSTLGAMRLLTAVAERAPGALAPLTRALFSRFFSGGDLAIEDPEVLEGALAEAGLAASDRAPLLEARADPATKERLKAATDEAVERGAFGAPTYFVHDGGREEMYFGSDRLAVMAFAHGLAYTGPVPGR